MESKFDFLNLQFFTKAAVYPGSIGTFRQSNIHRQTAELQVWVYENISFELAQDVETETFPWTEEGVTAIKVWLDEKLAQRGSQPYRIWAGNHVREKKEGEAT